MSSISAHLYHCFSCIALLLCLDRVFMNSNFCNVYDNHLDQFTRKFYDDLRVKHYVIVNEIDDQRTLAFRIFRMHFLKDNIEIKFIDWVHNLHCPFFQTNIIIIIFIRSQKKNYAITVSFLSFLSSDIDSSFFHRRYSESHEQLCKASISISCINFILTLFFEMLLCIQIQKRLLRDQSIWMIFFKHLFLYSDDLFKKLDCLFHLLVCLICFCECMLCR